MTRRLFFSIVLLVLLVVVLGGCAQEPEVVEVTRIVVEEVPAEPETVEIKVTREVEVEVTRIVEVEVTSEPIEEEIQEPVPEASLENASYQLFLQDNFDAALAGDVSQEQFLTVLNEITAGDGDAIEYPQEIDEEGFTILESILTAVYGANVDELAYTYPEEKADEALAAWSAVPEDLALSRKQELAAAIDTGLLQDNWQGVDLQSPVSAAFAIDLLGRILEFTGQYKHFLGDVTDPDIYGDILYTWDSFNQVSMPELQAPANDLIKEGVITGYNIKRTSNESISDPDNTIVYGHSNIAHAIQLIGLLRSEDMEAQVLLEPKTSAFLYLADWGEPTESPEFQVEPLEDGNYIAYAKEYDLIFEFDDAADKERFDTLIKQYAKKNEADQAGLLISSWWQPLYTSEESVEDYVPVKNNVISGNEFFVQSFSLPENSAEIMERFIEAYPDANVEASDLWVNQAFHNYLLGDSQ